MRDRVSRRRNRYVRQVKCPESNASEVLSAVPVAPQIQHVAPAAAAPKKKSVVWIVVVVIVLLVIFGFVLYALYKKRKRVQDDEKKKKPNVRDPFEQIGSIASRARASQPEQFSSSHVAAPSDDDADQAADSDTIAV